MGEREESSFPRLCVLSASAVNGTHCEAPSTDPAAARSVSESDSNWLPSANVAQSRTSRSGSRESFASASTTSGVSWGVNP